MNQINSTINQKKRYYWIKLEDIFFEREEIQLIESLPNGKEYVLLLLKLMMLAINSNGRLVVKNLFPYNPQMLATVTHSNVDTVRNAIDVFIKFGLMSTLDDGTLYMNEVQALLGSETEFAAKKREYRQNLKNQPKQITDSSKTQEDIVQDNVRQENRDKSLDNKENTPLPPNGDDGGGAVWLQIAKNLNLVFDDEEQSEIILWSKHLSDKHKKVTILQIETNLKNLARLKTQGYDICSMITDSVTGNCGWLLKPSATYIKKVVKALPAKPIKMVKPHRFGNPDYIIPENPAEKAQLAKYISECYRKNINPQTQKEMSADEIILIEKHKHVFSQNSRKFVKGQTITNGRYANWDDYILQNEINTMTPLIEQYLDDDLSSSKPSEA